MLTKYNIPATTCGEKSLLGRLLLHLLVQLLHYHSDGAAHA
jgi:hypothetical protein